MLFDGWFCGQIDANSVWFSWRGGACSLGPFTKDGTSWFDGYPPLVLLGYYLHPYAATFGLVLVIVTVKSAGHFISRIVLNHIMIISAEYGRILSVSRMCEIDIQSFWGISTCINAQGSSYRSSRAIVVMTLLGIDLQIIKIMTK